MPRMRPPQGQIAAGDQRRDGKRASLDPVRNDRMCGIAKPVNTLDADRIRAMS